jgi:DNA segregation ATPase FtsK/SpoIIIE, S-DNA-T family
MRDKLLLQPDGASVGWVTGSVLLALAMGAAVVGWHAGRLAARFVHHHRATTAAEAAAVLTRTVLGVAGLVALVVVVAIGLVVWRVQRPVSFDRYVVDQALFIRRRGRYRSQWAWWAFGNNLTKTHTTERLLSGDRSNVLNPKLVRIRCGHHLDRITFKPVVGQSLADWENATDALTLAMCALDCRVATDRPGLLRLDVIWSDPLAQPLTALPHPELVDLAAVAIGVREDGQPWTLRLLFNHLLIAGVTGAGKSSVLQSLIRGVAPAVADGSVHLWVIDPKGGMEFTPIKPMLTRFAAGDADAIVNLLTELVAFMDDRAARFAATGIRSYTPSLDEPYVLVVIDELAYLTAYLPDRKTRERIDHLLNLLLSKGRAIGIGIVGALQDPSKEVVKARGLFPTKIGLRLDSVSQVGMVLGDGARDAGARCDQIPDTTPGVAFVKVDGVREPVRVRAAYVSDDDIDATAAAYPAASRLRSVA